MSHEETPISALLAFETDFSLFVVVHSYKFRQRSNLWYLTGWEEPDSVLVLRSFLLCT